MKQLARPQPGDPDNALGRPLQCRFPRYVERILDSMADRIHGYPQDVIRSLVLEALSARAAGGQSMDEVLEAARAAGETAGYAEAHRRWRRALGGLLKNPPSAD